MKREEQNVTLQALPLKSDAKLDYKRNTLRHFLMMIAILSTICSSYCASAKGNNMKIDDLAISPDGRTIAFQYLDEESGRHGLGLLDWHSGKLTPIPTLPGKSHIGSASFTPDGKSLLAMTSSARDGQIVSVDLATLQMTKLAEAKRGWHSPVEQPGTDNILLVAGVYGLEWNYYVLLDPNTSTERIIIPPKEGFLVGGLFRPYFVAQDEIVFQAYAPKDPEVQKKVRAVVADDGKIITTNMAYHLKFGGKPEPILTNVIVNKASPQDGGISFVSASGDGKIFAFIANSRSEPLNRQGAYNLEIFIQKDGTIQQMTNMQSHMAYAEMSRDGTTVVFGAKTDRSSPRGEGHDFYIFDFQTSKVIPTNLRELLSQHLEFRLPKLLKMTQ